MPTITHPITSLAELETNATLLIDACTAALRPQGATVLALSGDLGAGKTTLVQSIARTLGVTGTVTSPTFVVMKQYETINSTFAELIHIDAYRIESIDELRPLGFATLLAQPNTLICIEWAERIAAALPAAVVAATLTLLPGGERTITITTT